MAPNMNPKKMEMPVQDPMVRNANFKEVALGYTVEMAQEEANRCLNCKTMPCVSGCPVNVKIPDFISEIKKGDFEKAYEIIKQTSSLPAVCGRVCPQESQCESKCVRGIKTESVGIGRLERFVADYHMEHSTEEVVVPESNGHKVAIVGAGPAGLTCAGDLAKKGYKVTVFEALHLAGGVLVYGIPEFRLPKTIVQKEIDTLKAMGVEVLTNMVIGKVLSIDELFEQGYEAIFVGSGAGLPNFMNIPGENSVNIMSSNEYLTRVNLMDASNPETDTPIETLRDHIVCLLIGIFIGCYDGMIGPGTGTFMIMAFTFVLGMDLLTASGCAKMGNLASNIASAVLWAINGQVMFGLVIPAAACNMLGSWFGSQYAIRGGSQKVRGMIYVVLALLFLKFFYELFFAA